jgi:hypothetical protein
MEIADKISELWHRWESAVDWVFVQNRPFFHISVFAVAVFLAAYLVIKIIGYSARKLRAGRSRYADQPAGFGIYQVVQEATPFGQDDLKIAVSNNSFRVDGKSGKEGKKVLQNGDQVRVILRYLVAGDKTPKDLTFTAILEKRKNMKGGVWEANDCQKIAFGERLKEKFEKEVNLDDINLRSAKIELNENIFNSLALATTLSHPSRDIRLAMTFFYLSLVASGLFMAIDKIFF